MTSTRNDSQISIFDRIMENKIKLGIYQLKHMLILILIDANEGSQLVLMSFLMPLIQNEWGISHMTVSILTSLFYLGTSTGSCLTGKIADTKGRKISITYSAIALFLASMSFVLVQNVYQLAIARYLYGCIYGFGLPLTTSMLSEIIPIKYRGKGLVIVNMFISVGKIVGCFLAIICLDSFHSGNWRLMMMLSAFPSLIVLWGSIYVINESPRFLIASNQIQKGVDVLNDMIIQNNKKQSYELVTNIEQQELKEWSEQVFEQNRQGGAAVKQLLSSELKGTTIRLWICWFIENAMYFGQLAILPFILGKTNKSFGNYILTILGEIPSIFISLVIVDTKGLGRKNSLTICFVLSGFMHFFTYYADKDNMSLYASIARFFMKLVYAMLYPLSTESYPTLLRTLGFGYCSGVGRLGAAFIPYLIFSLLSYDVYSSFYIFGIISFLAAISSATLPFCTMGRNLDQNTDQTQKNIHQSVTIEDIDDDVIVNKKKSKQNIPLINQKK